MRTKAKQVKKVIICNYEWLLCFCELKSNPCVGFNSHRLHHFFLRKQSVRTPYPAKNVGQGLAGNQVLFLGLFPLNLRDSGEAFPSPPKAFCASLSKPGQGSQHCSSFFLA
jgi:hypothetical protein